jgi:hypothetical protein
MFNFRAHKFPLKKENGSAMIIVIAAISFLILVSFLIITANKNDYIIATNHLNNLRAQYAAEAGLNYAIASMRNETCVNSVDTTAEPWYGTKANRPLGDNPYEEYTLCGGLSGYEVKEIIDSSRLIYVNDDNTNSRMENIINNLGVIIGGSCDGDEGTKILSLRPSDGYNNRDQIHIALSDAEYEAIKDYLSAYNWVDSQVIDPQDTSTPYASLPRAPINVNTAPREVLAAVLYNIQGGYCCPRCGGDGRLYDGTVSGKVCPACAGSGNLAITLTEAGNLADYIIANRPYKTWSEFYVSIKGCADIDEGDVDLVLANANPNTGINAYLRNYGWGQKAGRVGKYVDTYKINPADPDKGLTNNTTEFCFNSGGYYEISCRGISFDNAGNETASKKIRAVVKIFDIWKQTTQEDFQNGTLSNLITLPEPISAGIAPAAYDGQICLDTFSESASADTLLLANFTDNLELDYQAAVDMQLDLVANTCIVDSLVSSSDPGSLLPEGVLLNNRKSDVLAYWEDYNGSYNMGRMDKGTISMWIKVVSGGEVKNSLAEFSGYDLTCYEAPAPPGNYSKPEFSIFAMYSGHYIATHPTPWHGWKEGYTDRAEVWFINDWDTLLVPETPIGFAGMQEIGKNVNPGATHPSDPDASQIITKGTARMDWAPGTWHRVVYTYELDAPTAAVPDPLTGVKTLYFDGAEPDLYTKEPYNKFNGDVYKIAFGLGEHTPSTYIVDEIKVDHDCWSLTDVQSDYAGGRYYDSNDSFFTSSSKNLPQVQLGTVYWVEYMPDELKPHEAGGDIEIDIYDGSAWIGGHGSRNSSAGCALNTPTTGLGDIRYRAYFKTETPSSPKVPILGITDTPILDEVSITYLTDSKILYWRFE